MSKKILIDLLKLRDLKPVQSEALDHTLIQGKTFKTIRELATFQFTCRKCEDAPCIAACPADALEKDEHGIIHRAVNLCVRCKSCIAMCPFGTLMNDIFETKTSGYSYFDLSDEQEMVKFAAAFPKEMVSIVEMEENPKEHIYQLSENVLVKDYLWDQ